MDSTHKTCSACSADVTAAKRFKDSKGRVFCVACTQRLKAGTKSHGGAHATQTAPPTGELDDGTIALADEVVARDESFLHTSKASGTREGGGIRDLELCPDCGLPWGSSVICTNCGFNRITGEHVGVNVPPPVGTDPSIPIPKPPKPCVKCGYDLTGLKTARCPECGTVNPRLKRGQQTEKQQLRQMYLRPLLIIACGLALSLVIRFAIGAATVNLAGGGEAVAKYLIYFPISLVVGFVAYVVCSMLFIGFDEPLGVTFVRLGAVYAVTDAVTGLLSPIPVFGLLVGWIIAGIVYLGMLVHMMELELEDAWLVVASTFFIKVAVGFMILYIWATYF